MNRYKSRYRWRKVEAGCYESRDGQYSARQTGKHWQLRVVKRHGKNYVNALVGSFLTLADCQEHAERWRP